MIIKVLYKNNFVLVILEVRRDGVTLIPRLIQASLYKIQGILKDFP